MKKNKSKDNLINNQFEVEESVSKNLETLSTPKKPVKKLLIVCFVLVLIISYFLFDDFFGYTSAKGNFLSGNFENAISSLAKIEDYKDSKDLTTTTNGVDEQSVYSNYRFLYLRDGIIYAIQD